MVKDSVRPVTKKSFFKPTNFVLLYQGGCGVDQKLFENVREFLEKEKNCSNVEVYLPIEQPEEQILVKLTGKSGKPKYGQVNIGGGRFFREGEYVWLEVYCINCKKANESLFKKFGELFWQKFWLSKLQTWADYLYLYLLLSEDEISLEVKKFCESFGFGVLKKDKQNVITEVCPPQNQNRLLQRKAEKAVRLECSDPSHLRMFNPDELKCPECGAPLKTNVWLYDLFADYFQGSTKKQSQKVPGQMPERVKKNPFLQKLFQNWNKVQEAFR